METTVDALLNRRIQIEQPAKGFRVAVDTVLLASAVRARAGEKAIDLGCGVGGAMLCLAARVNSLQVDGLEMMPKIAEIAKRNVTRNRMDNRMQVFTGDVTRLPGHMLFAYDHVLMNPPYHEAAKHDASPNTAKAAANTEPTGMLEMWLTSAARCLKQTGMLTMIHRADRLDEILRLMKPMFGTVEILPLLPRKGEEAKRIILRSRKGEGATPVMCRPLILHRPNGGYTDETEAMLKHAKPLEFAQEEETW